MHVVRRREGLLQRLKELNLLRVIFGSYQSASRHYNVLSLLVEFSWTA
jgi:hypothetical protein